MKLIRACGTLGKYTFGKILREVGYELDMKGSMLTKDIGYLERLSRHRKLMNLYDKIPYLAEDAVVEENATLVGEVYVGRNSHVGFNTVVKGDLGAVRIGENTRIGDLVNIQTENMVPAEIPSSVTIGNNVTIGSGCTLYACTIDDDVTIGKGCTVMNGAVIERGAVIEPGSTVQSGRLIPSKQLWGGTPSARLIKEL